MSLKQSRVKILSYLFWGFIYYLNPYGLFDLIFFEIRQKARYLWRARDKSIKNQTKGKYIIAVLLELTELMMSTIVIILLMNFFILLLILKAELRVSSFK